MLETGLIWQDGPSENEFGIYLNPTEVCVGKYVTWSQSEISGVSLQWQCEHQFNIEPKHKTNT